MAGEAGEIYATGREGGRWRGGALEAVVKHIKGIRHVYPAVSVGITGGLTQGLHAANELPSEEKNDVSYPVYTNASHAIAVTALERNRDR